MSSVDIPLLGSQANAVFVAKKEIGSWPVIGWAVTGIGTIYIDRKNRHQVAEINQKIREAFAKGYWITIFPEGGITPADKIHPLKSPLLEPFISDDIPIRYATIRYETGPGDPPVDEAVCGGGSGCGGTSSACSPVVESTATSRSASTTVPAKIGSRSRVGCTRP
jgi:1-acyl-sn-glycerol-3-phosphate acyltransferase